MRTIKQLTIKNLQVNYRTKKVLRDVNFSIDKGEVVCIVGESGSGKTTFVKAITKLLEDASIKGEILYDEKDLLNMKPSEIKKLRWNDIAYVFQNPKECLNPRMKLREQLYEVLLKKYSKVELKEKSKELLKEVRLDEDSLDKYPNELSGGMLQKFCIAMAISLNPEVIIFDEPTSALDVFSKKYIVNIINKLKLKNKTVIIVTHDLKLAKEYSDKLVVLYNGSIVEYGLTKNILTKPMHMYTKGLINSSVDLNPYKELNGIPGIAKYEEGGCPFYSRCTQHIASCKLEAPRYNHYEDREVYCNRGGILKLLDIENMEKTFGNKNILNKCNMDLYFSEIVSIIGASGSGKTTLANIIAGFDEEFSGKIKLNLEDKLPKDMIKEFEGIQVITQNPYDSINRNLTVYEVIGEPLSIKKIEKENIKKQVVEILSIVGLLNDEEFLNKKIRELSGGQVQRISIARALIMRPKILIADEITSMMDPSNKANILKYLKSLQNRIGFSMIFITHDLHLANRISDRIYVLNDKKLVEACVYNDLEKLEELIG